MTRDVWNPNDSALFEYHCLEAHDSNDAALWYRSHQRVTVLSRAEDEDWQGEGGKGSTLQDRIEAGMPNCYRVRFADGHEGTVFEDELSTSEGDWYRPDPPKMGLYMGPFGAWYDKRERDPHENCPAEDGACQFSREEECTALNVSDAGRTLREARK